MRRRAAIALKIRFYALAYIGLLVGGLICAFPFFWMFTTSLKTDAQVILVPPKWIPEPFVWSNYTRALGTFPFLRSLANTTYLAAMSLAGMLISSPLVAYSLSRLNWKGRNLVFVVLLATMMLPFSVRMVPLFLIFNKLGWVNTFKPLWVPHFFGDAFFIFLLRQFLMTIPKELEDAARIDGCNSYAIYWRVMLPLIKPALTVVVILGFMNVWNDFLGPLIYLTSPEKHTLSLALEYFRSESGTDWSGLMAVSTIVIFPILTVFFIFQRYFIKGIVLTGLKG